MFKLHQSVLLLLLAICVNRSVLAAHPAVSFSASYTSTVVGAGDGGRSMSGKVWVSQGKIRRETEHEGHVMVLLVDPANHKYLQLVPDQGIYEDVGGKLADVKAMLGGPADLFVDNPHFPCRSQEGLSCTATGTATVDGRKCDEWLYSDREVNEWSECIDQSLPILIEKKQPGRIFELTNIRVGHIDPKLFKVPPDLKPAVLHGQQ